jgi:integrase
MKARKLTDIGVRNAKTGVHPDLGQRGLCLHVHKSGRQSWIIRYRHPVTRVSRKLTLPTGLSLAQARKLAGDAMFQVAQGVDPIEHKKHERQRTVLADENTVRAICENYMKIEGKNLRSVDGRAGVLKRAVYPYIGSMQITDVEREHITRMLDKVTEKSGASAADMSLAITRKIFNWHETRTSRFRSPIVRGMRRIKVAERARTRSLSDDELKRIWRASFDPRLSASYGACVRFLVLSGSRKSEASKMRRGEVETIRDNGDAFVVWRLPASRSKNKREIIRPLSKAALAIIQGQPVIGSADAASAFVFSLNGRNAVNMNNNKAKKLLDKLSGVSDWVLHDTRRTFRSMLSRLRVPFETAERMLGHAQDVLTRTYDQHSHLPAMQEAVDRLASEIERVVDGNGKVIRLRS